jgi:hypothetical protein
MEHEISGFLAEYAAFEQLEHEFYERLGDNAQGRTQEKIDAIQAEYRNLDVKMRLAFGIVNIDLGPLFVDKKYGPLKECHLLYYKLADLWFAYETFITFLSKVRGMPIQQKVDWIGYTTYTRFMVRPLVAPAHQRANEELQAEFGVEPRRGKLDVYLEYCKNAPHVSGPQKVKLESIRQAMIAGTPLSVVQFISLAYAIRCNFVHNGETTVVPDNFSFENKWQLLKIVYRFMAICLLTWVNQAMSEV